MNFDFLHAMWKAFDWNRPYKIDEDDHRKDFYKWLGENYPSLLTYATTVQPEARGVDLSEAMWRLGNIARSLRDKNEGAYALDAAKFIDEVRADLAHLQQAPQGADLSGVKLFLEQIVTVEPENDALWIGTVKANAYGYLRDLAHLQQAPQYHGPHDVGNTAICHHCNGTKIEPFGTNQCHACHGTGEGCQGGRS